MGLDNSNNKLNVSAIILAGGNSSRMKFPKPWLKIGNTTFLENIISTYKIAGITDIAIVMNKKFCEGEWKNQVKPIEQYSKIIKNNEVEKGRLNSVRLGLNALTNKDFVFIQNIDNPFITQKVIEKLFQNKFENGVTVPTLNSKGGHPILINKTIKEDIINNFDPSSTLYDVINQFERKNIEVESKSILMNINTPEDYKKALNEFL
jgi:molybdenum cofactor cytidylyltransferase